MRDQTCLTAYIVSLVRDFHVAEDVYQEVCVKAIAAADQMIKKSPDDSRVMRSAGDIYLRAGKVETATKLFNKYIKKVPDEMPYLRRHSNR